MNPTLIEWTLNPDGTQGYTSNSKTGCLNGCPYCYARKLAHGRLKQRYLANRDTIASDPLKKYSSWQFDPKYIDPFYPRWWPERLEQIRKHKKPAGIFLNDMSDWMGDYWPEEWTEQEFQIMRDCPQHRFYTLTKQPKNLAKWSPFPDNCWVGVTATDDLGYGLAIKYLAEIEATVKFISFEPLLESPAVVNLTHGEVIKWLIIGACTGSLNSLKYTAMMYPELPLLPHGKMWTLQPKIDWVQEIVEAADRAGVAMFLKNNLRTLVLDGVAKHQIDRSKFLMDRELRQEMPE